MDKSDIIQDEPLYLFLGTQSNSAGWHGFEKLLRPEDMPIKNGRSSTRKMKRGKTRLKKY